MTKRGRDLGVKKTELALAGSTKRRGKQSEVEELGLSRFEKRRSRSVGRINRTASREKRLGFPARGTLTVTLSRGYDIVENH